MNSKIFVEKHGKMKIINIFILTVLRRKVRVKNVFVTKVDQELKKNAYQKQSLLAIKYRPPTGSVARRATFDPRAFLQSETNLPIQIFKRNLDLVIEKTFQKKIFFKIEYRPPFGSVARSVTFDPRKLFQSDLNIPREIIIRNINLVIERTFQKQLLFRNKNWMLYSIKYEEHPGDLKKVEEEQSQVNDIRLQEKLRKQSYNHD